MFTAQNYSRPTSAEEAWTLNQSRGNKILGGMCWLKMGHKRINTLIDLSALALDHIEETDTHFKIGAMCTLGQLERHPSLEQYFDGMIGEMLKHIVGTQFRNVATIGGSVYSRFGFSDVLTSLMALDASVELYKGGLVSLEEFAKMPWDRDLCLNLVIRKATAACAYSCYRNTATDLPVLNCAVSLGDNGLWKIIYGARPGKAIAFENDLPGLDKLMEEDIQRTADLIRAKSCFYSNTRGSAAYRNALIPALLTEAINKIRESQEKKPWK